MRAPRRSLSSLVIIPGAVGIAAIATVAVATPVQAGNFLDAIGAIFGGPPQPAYRAPPVEYYGNPYGDEPGLEMTVRPKRKRAPAPEVASGPPPNTAIDPKANPNWYLDDPTLRRGDIVVLADRVIVYEGGRGSPAIEDYASLDQSRLVSKSDKARIGAMAGLTRVVPGAVAEAAPSKSSRKTARRGKQTRTATVEPVGTGLATAP